MFSSARLREQADRDGPGSMLHQWSRWRGCYRSPLHKWLQQQRRLCRAERGFWSLLIIEHVVRLITFGSFSESYFSRNVYIPTNLRHTVMTCTYRVVSSYRLSALKSRFSVARLRDTLSAYSTRLRDWITCLISDSGIICRLALTKACAISSISANLGLGIGGRITGVLMRPRSQTAVLYRTWRRPISSKMLRHKSAHMRIIPDDHVRKIQTTTYHC